MSDLIKLLEGVKVEWKTLGEISELYGGLKGKSKNDFTDGNAKYVTYKNIFNNIEINFDTLESVKVSPTESQYEIQYGDVLFTGSSEIASEAGMSSSVTKSSDTKIYLNSFSFGLRFNPEIKLIPEFTKYLFRSKYMRDAIAKTASGVTRYNISKKRFVKLQIPIPCPDNPEKSLKIQQEIVRILDRLSEETNQLTAALQKELDLHQKQYNFYREELFKFEGKEVGWKKISEIGKFQRGKRFVRTDMISEGVPCIHYGEMYTHYGISAVQSKSYLNREFALAKKLRVADKGDVVIVAAGETVEDIGKGTAWLGDEGVVIHDACFSYKSPLNPTYFAYFTRTSQYHDQIKRNISSGKISAINEKGFSSVIIPVPSPEEQNRIVKILDDLDAKTQAIIQVIQKEIALRNKQYKYYRDHLLSFHSLQTEAEAIQ